MRGMRFSSLVILAVAVVAMGLWVVGCSDQGSPKLLLPPHGDQAVPNGAYSIAWTGVDVSGTGRIVVPGQTDMTLTADQVKDLVHALFNVNAAGHHGWAVAPVTDANGDVRLAVDPHPHGAAQLLLCYCSETGRVEGCSPLTFQAPSAGLNTLLKDYIARTTGIPNPQDVTALKFGAAAVSYSFHWRNDAKTFEPAEAAYPAMMANGITIEGVFYVGETEGNFTATIDRMVGDVSGAQVAECPECALGAPPPVHKPPIEVNP